MRIIALLIVVAALAPPMKSQVRVVNPNDPLAYASISQALAAPPALVAGAVIQVYGITSGGQPTGYSNAPILTGQAAESFPLMIPDGVSIQSADASLPVYVYSTTPVPALLQVVFSASTTGVTTRIDGLTILGGSIGIEVSNSASSTKTVLVQSCTFTRNQIGLSCIESGAGTMNLAIVECTLACNLPSGLTPPAAVQSPGIGFQFHANESTPSQVPVVQAEISELQTNTGYGGTFEFPYLGNVPPDLSFRTIGTNGMGDFSRIIEVFAIGSALDHGVPGRIAEVALSVNGGEFKGSLTDWMVGIYAAVEGAGKFADVQDYTAGYNVVVTGTEFEKLSACGVYATSVYYGRGLVTLQGGTAIVGTAAASPREAGDYLLSGVHGFCYDGYLGIVGVNSRFEDNAGHGVYLAGLHTNVDAQGGQPAIERIGPYPVGAYLRLSRCDIHGNSGSGVAVAFGEDQFQPYPLVTPEGPSISGGTWYESQLNLLDLREKVGFELPNGPGLINRCRISNNGEHGVYAFCYGMSHQTFTPQPYAVSFHMVNNMIWNNPMGGFLAVLSNSTGWDLNPLHHGPTLLVPIVHCTFAGNGSSMYDPNIPTQPLPVQADWSIEVYEDVNWQGHCRYEWHFNPMAPGTPGSYLLTRIFNSIFQRSLPLNAALDFGPQLENFIGWPDNSNPNQVNDNLIGVAGVRATTFTLQSSAEWNDKDALSAFLGPVNLLSRTAGQFLLSSYGTNSRFGFTPSWIWSFVGAAQSDYSGNQRQQPIQNPNQSPEQGADEL